MTIDFLLVEDEELSAELLERILRPIVTRIDMTRTLEGALNFATGNHYDIILFDLRLLDSDVDSSIAAIPSLKKLSEAPLLVVTGMSDPTLKDRCLKAGADGFIPKMDAYSPQSKALYLAVFTCSLHHSGKKSDGFMEKVRILEHLVNAA